MSRLTPAQLDAIKARLEAVWPPRTRSCACCGKAPSGWTIVGAVETREFTGGLLPHFGSSSLPLLAVTCQDCGLAVFFSAIVLGIVDATTGKYRL
jgi:hypothetical protein